MKKQYTVPAILLLYLTGIALYTYPGRNPQISWWQYGLTIGITFVCIIALSYLLKRKAKFREEMRRKREEEKKSRFS